MDRRLVISIAGGVLLAVALVGVLLAEADDGGRTVLTFPIAWSTEDGPTSTRTGTLEEGENESFGIGVAPTNVTEVEVRLVWEDDVGERDTFRLSVTPPGGPERTNASRNGTVVLTFPLASVPDAQSINASDPEAARQQALDRFTTRQGQGTWNVTVTLESAPGQRPVPNAPQLETEPDGSNDYQMSVSFSRYTGQVADTPAT